MAEVKDIPIRWGKYVNHEMEEQKVIFVGAEKAIYDKDGKQLDTKLVAIEESISDAFSEGKDYAAGDYCVYENRVFKFTKAKAAGAWDGTAVLPISLTQEIAGVRAGVEGIRGSFNTSELIDADLLEHAESLPERTFNLFRTNDSVSNSPFNFTIGTILRYGENTHIVAYDMLSEAIKHNTRSRTGEWSGWFDIALKSDLVIKTGVPISEYGTFATNSYVKRAGNAVSVYVDFTATKSYTGWTSELFTLPSGFAGDSRYTLVTLAEAISKEAISGAFLEGYRFQIGKNLSVGTRVAFGFTVIL